MCGQIPVEPVGVSLAQRTQPFGGVCIRGFGLRLGHVEPGTKVAPDRRLALDFGQPANRPDVVALNAREIILRLSVEHAEHGIGIRGRVDVWDTEIVAQDLDARCARFESCRFRVTPGFWLRRTAGHYKEDRQGEKHESGGALCGFSWASAAAVAEDSTVRDVVVSKRYGDGRNEARRGQAHDQKPKPISGRGACTGSIGHGLRSTCCR